MHFWIRFEDRSKFLEAQSAEILDQHQIASTFLVHLVVKQPMSVRRNAHIPYWSFAESKNQSGSAGREFEELQSWRADVVDAVVSDREAVSINGLEHRGGRTAAIHGDLPKAIVGLKFIITRRVVNRFAIFGLDLNETAISGHLDSFSAVSGQFPDLEPPRSR
jgi:hypothetical protein